ncbi:hypothetical protein DdX_03512 [Ditylenchus destructor]|uniref:Uncharacterized protein n=1 Tax=Ditylenchus destructor TaxID=166010 RepID=A0AAD4NAH2_9BILA|nr:hypothetical protein DdX_03512 [Ditylenchus destructor]
MKQFLVLEPPPRFIPSPIQETLLEKPKPLKIVPREWTGSRASLATSVDVSAQQEPQRAQHARIRPFEADPIDELSFAAPPKQSFSVRDVREIMGSAQRPTSATLEKPKPQNAEVMYLRPGFDNVPSY